ncbi:MAG: hypothetical protein KH296_14835 [Ruminococcus sp.]|nr:hypothetical protein [Ruminococcus sp.]
MKKIKKKLVAVILAVNMLVIGIFGSYQTAQAAEIVAGYTALEVIEGILLSFGISVFTTEMVSTLTEDPKTAQDEYWRETQAAHWAEYMEAAYEEERKKGGGGSGPTPTPGVTGSDIPSFKEVIQNMKNTGKIVLGAAAGAGVWECMSKAVSSLWNKMMGRPNNVDSSIPADAVNLIASEGYPYYAFRIVNYNDLVLFGPGSFRYDGGSYALRLREYYQYPGKSYYIVDERPVVNSSKFYGAVDRWMTNLPYFSTYEEGIEWSKQEQANADKYKKENIWVHPDLQDTYKNNGKLEYPQQAPQPLQIPSIAQLTDLANKLKTNPQQSPNSVQELIDQLKQNPQPQPTVAPNPNPNPNPNPDPNPNPEVTPKPDDTTTDVNPDDYKADLRLVFPFCIPFDLVHLIQAFEAEPEAPVFEFPLDLELENPWTGKKILDYHHVFKLDMSDYEPVIKIFRIFEIIFFIIGLLMITRQQMIKG